MKISGRLARRNVQIQSIRALVLGVCAAILSLSFEYVSVSREAQTIVYLTTALLFLFAAATFGYSLVGNFPDEYATLKPEIRLPKSLASGGLNCELEPIEFWMRDPMWNKNVLLGTKNRQLLLSGSLLPKDQWMRLIAALPADKKVQPPAMKDSINMALLAYATFFVATHFLLQEPSELQIFNFLAYGGYNAQMSSHGELYRALSYSWVHGSTAHLWMNLVALLFVAQALGKSFSNATLTSVLIVTAVVSGVAGNLTKDFNILVGASGAIMGLFGFLFAAQLSKDKRLNPLARLARQKSLYAVLFAEFVLSIRYSWYGGSVHLAGFAAGYGLYFLMSALTEHKSWQTRSQLVILSCGMILFGSWAVHTYQALKQPKLLIKKALGTHDPFLTFVASTALPDIPNTTRGEVLAARQQAIDLLKTNTLLAWPLARTDYWLGNSQTALNRLREFSALEPDSAEVQKLWLAVERDDAVRTRSGEPVATLPEGPGTAYLISADFSLFARIKLPNKTTPVAAALRSRKKINWHLLDVTVPLHNPKSAAFGVWPLPKTSFRTATSANIAKVAPN